MRGSAISAPIERPKTRPTDAPADGPSLKSRAIRGSMWTFTSYGGAQVLRLISNLILTRLLFPEAFGLMALVTVFMQGLQMFSDIGIAPNIIQSKRGEDPRFLNTAWTIQVIRGAALWLGSVAIAWPVASIYGEPQLRWMLPVAGLASVILGFNSTSLATLNRRIAMKKLTLLDLVGHGTSIVVMIVWALISPSVVALLAGGLTGAVVRMAGSHFLIAGHHCRFAWDQTAAGEMFRFGRWVFVATILTFLAMQSDRLLLGRLFDIGTLGIYTIALSLAQVMPMLCKRVGSLVGFPVLAEIARERPGQLKRHLRRVRLVLIVPSLCILLPIAFFGHELMALLYDDRYALGGWMLNLLAIGAMANVVCASCGHALLALGDTFRHMLPLATHWLILLTASVTGYVHYGTEGFIVGVAAAELLNYPVLAFMLFRRGLWQPEVDLPVLLGIAAILVYAARHLI